MKLFSTNAREVLMLGCSVVLCAPQLCLALDNNTGAGDTHSVTDNKVDFINTHTTHITSIDNEPTKATKVFDIDSAKLQAIQAVIRDDVDDGLKTVVDMRQLVAEEAIETAVIKLCIHSNNAEGLHVGLTPGPDAEGNVTELFKLEQVKADGSVADSLTLFPAVMAIGNQDTVPGMNATGDPSNICVWTPDLNGWYEGDTSKVGDFTAHVQNAVPAWKALGHNGALDKIPDNPTATIIHEKVPVAQNTKCILNHFDRVTYNSADPLVCGDKKAQLHFLLSGSDVMKLSAGRYQIKLALKTQKCTGTNTTSGSTTCTYGQ